MGNLDRVRGETINQTKPIGFLVSQIKPNQTADVLKPNRIEPKGTGSVQFGLVTSFLFYFFHKKMAIQLVRDVGFQVTK